MRAGQVTVYRYGDKKRWEISFKMTQLHLHNHPMGLVLKNNCSSLLFMDTLIAY